MAKGKIYSIKGGSRILPTTQNSVVVPTSELIKKKGIDLRVLACISAISNVDDWSREGDNNRYCSVDKINSNLDNLCNLLDIDRTKLMRRIREIIKVDSYEFKKVQREVDAKQASCVEIKYESGGFITIDCGVLEGLVSNLSNNAFKLYVNLLWLCKDVNKNQFIERQLTQEFLLPLMGLAKSSKRVIRIAEAELVEKNLIEVRTKWETKIRGDFEGVVPVAKKYYKIKNA